MHTELIYPVTIFDNKTVLDCNGVDSKLSQGIRFSVSNHHNKKFKCYNGATCTNFRNNRLLLSNYFVYTVPYMH